MKIGLHNEEEYIITQTKTKMYIVRSLSMTNWLCNHGFKILKVEDSEKDSRFKVFLFEDTAALHDTMARFNRKGREAYDNRYTASK